MIARAAGAIRLRGGARDRPLALRKLTDSRRNTLNGYVNACEFADDRSKADFRLCCWAIERGLDVADLRVRRPGRGIALDRTKRSAVWALIAAYRAQSRVDGGLEVSDRNGAGEVYERPRRARNRDGSHPANVPRAERLCPVDRRGA